MGKDQSSVEAALNLPTLAFFVNQHVLLNKIILCN